MNVSREYLERCAAETGYRTSALEKVIRLAEVSGSVARHARLRAALLLKGGTALNLCLGTPSRLSVDLDYNYVGHAHREAMLAERPSVEQAVESIAQRLGYATQRSQDTFAGRKLFLTYGSESGARDRIEIDLNFLYRTSLEEPVTLEMWQPGELDRPNVRTVSVLEICVGKLLALLDRGAPRDAWDVQRFPAIAADVVSSARFRTWFVALSATLVHPLSTYTQARLKDHLSDKRVQEELIPMLTLNARPRANELVDSAWAVLEPLVDLKAAELDYIAAIHEGELRPELLCGSDIEFADRIRMHPAIQWKVKSVREHRSSKRSSKRKR